ncbi:MAG TPA: hypothetical protein VF585_02185 [Chthoniobacterales bacterium]|jgi:hypothetical protein
MTRLPNLTYESRVALKFAIFVPLVFTTFFLLTYPPLPSLPPSGPPDLIAAQTVLVLGVIAWVITFLACVQASRQRRYHPFVVTSFVLFLLFGLELYFAGLVIYVR